MVLLLCLQNLINGLVSSEKGPVAEDLDACAEALMWVAWARNARGQWLA